MTYDIELGNGDSEDVSVVLTENGVAIDLTGTSVTFCMQLDVGTTGYTIPCIHGARIKGESISSKFGAVSIPFSPQHTSQKGIFLGEFKVSRFGKVSTYPNNRHLTIQIKPTIGGY